MSDSSHSANTSVARLIWSRMIWRHWRAEPRLTAVLVGILALGVAVFLAIRLANKAAVTGFGLFTESVAGESDFIVRAPAGRIDEDVLRELRRSLGATPVGIFPVLEVSGTLAKDAEKSLLRFVGADLVALQNAENYAEGDQGGPTGGFDNSEESAVLGERGRGFVASGFLTSRDLAEEDPLDILVNDLAVRFEIAGVLPEIPNRPAVPENLVLMDLPGLQSLSGEVGRLSRVEFRIAPGSRYDEYRAQVREHLDAFAGERDLIVETPEDRSASVTQMSAAFRLNLTILSGLALLVGLYLILQAMEAAVVKRRGEIAILRSLGVTRRQIRAAWLLEGVALGLIGSVLGIILGRLLATGLVGGIAQTVNTLYYETTTTAVNLEPAEIVFCLLFGTGASLVAGLVPAREASVTPPAQTMKQGSQGGGLALLRYWPIGLILLGVGIILAKLPPVRVGESIVPVGGYLAAVVLVLAFSILIGLLFRPVAKLLGLGSGAMRGYAASQLRRAKGRHRLTSAGLAVAIGMSAAMGILVASFEHTLTSWIEQLLKADLYVAAPGMNSVANENTISEVTWSDLAALPAVAGMDKLRRYTISIDGRDAFLGGADYNNDPERFLQLIWIDPPADRGPLSLVERNEGAIPAWISEAFSRRFEVAKGETVSLPTPSGTREVQAVGVFAEYGNETGTIIVGRNFTSEWFDDSRVSQIAVYAQPEADAEALLAEIEERFPAVVARTNERLRAESIRVFHQTFAVTYALEAIAVFIAVAGLGLALAGLLLERRTELATLKSLGANRKAIAIAAVWEGVGVTLVGLVGGFLLSFLLGWVLIFVINPQSFGWTLGYRVPWASFFLLAILTLVTAAMVAAVVGYKNADLQSERRE